MGWGLNLGYASVLTAAAPYLAWRAARTGRYREGWSERLLGSVPEIQTQSSIWCHGVSLGEVQLLRPLIERLSEVVTDRQIVLSTSTLTGMQVARKSLNRFSSFYCPMDFTWAVTRALNRLHPSLIVMGELEVWPNLIQQASQRKIPIAIVNGRLSDRSFDRYQRFRYLVGKTFSRLDLVGAQDEVTAERFIRLGVPQSNVHVTGSLKFDNVNMDREHAEVQTRRALMGLDAHHRVFVAGSTQAPEEQTAIDAVKQLLPQHPNLKLVLVPRHPERFGEVYQLAIQSGLKVLRRSEMSSPVKDDQWQVLLVDSVGELKWWWGLAEIALVGGSFGSRGGQNMLEPAAYGAKVAFGPNTWNFRHIVKSLIEKQAAWELPTLDAVAGWIDDQLSHPEQEAERTRRATQWIKSHQGATDRTLVLLNSLLEKTGYS